ncbi:protein EXORDIUM-like protein 2 [Cinnamomum micranthum f. kanehirae]|uniref:Protein EXORDIUM-like protein 2 n=1 Tax=Cinnamomum micranthum f. kanehirae TaxID=337451 RepID=A0A443PTW3_9MAGN|nr:protein EXORDIUM-like protein 2 [Cinnamomum micranthum f. kanehirae]
MARFRKTFLLPLISLVALATASWSHGLNPGEQSQPSSLVPSSTQLQYHHGPLLTGPRSIDIYLIWYGAFSPSHKSTISAFFTSFNPSTNTLSQPTVSTWWKTTQAYKDMAQRPISSTVRLAGQVSDATFSLGKNLKRASIATLVKNAVVKRVFPFNPNSVYFVLTAPDVAVERFCMSSCGFHDSILVSPKQRVVFAHVGDPESQCPGLCAWPFAIPAYGPPGQALVAPNGVGIDGMVMNIATILAGAATNPFKNGYFQGDATAPLEAVTSCPGIFGAGAYPGYPGELKIIQKSRASYNVYGINNHFFLLPAMWDPLRSTCAVIS